MTRAPAWTRGGLCFSHRLSPWTGTVSAAEVTPMTDSRMTTRLGRVHPRQRALFVAMLPLIRKHLSFGLRHVPRAERQEHIDDALAHAFVLFALLARRNRVGLAYPTALARYALCRI